MGVGRVSSYPNSLSDFFIVTLNVTIHMLICMEIMCYKNLVY